MTEVAGKLNRYKLKIRNQIEIAVAKAVKRVKELIDIELFEHKSPYSKKNSAGWPGPNSIFKDHIKITYEL